MRRRPGLRTRRALRGPQPALENRSSSRHTASRLLHPALISSYYGRSLPHADSVSLRACAGPIFRPGTRRDGPSDNAGRVPVVGGRGQPHPLRAALAVLSGRTSADRHRTGSGSRPIRSASAFSRGSCEAWACRAGLHDAGENTDIEEVYHLPLRPDVSWLRALVRPWVRRGADAIWREDLAVALCNGGWPGVLGQDETTAHSTEPHEPAPPEGGGRWVRVAEQEDVPKGHAQAVDVEGRNIVLWRPRGTPARPRQSLPARRRPAVAGVARRRPGGLPMARHPVWADRRTAVWRTGRRRRRRLSAPAERAGDLDPPAFVGAIRRKVKN